MPGLSKAQEIAEEVWRFFFFFFLLRPPLGEQGVILGMETRFEIRSMRGGEGGLQRGTKTQIGFGEERR